MKKSFQRKKDYRRANRERAKNGLMNGPDGLWRPKGSFPDSSMRRDFNGGRG